MTQFFSPDYIEGDKNRETTISSMNEKSGEFTVYSHDLHDFIETFIRNRERSLLLPELSFR